MNANTNTETFDPDSVINFSEMPPLRKPKANMASKEPLPVNSQFITEIRCRSLYARMGLDFDLQAAKPISRDHLYTLLERQIRPAVKCFDFMGKPLPKVGVVAHWSKDTDGNVSMHYAGPILTDDVDEDELNAMLDTALINANRGEIPMTLGHVPIPLFAQIFCIVAQSVDQSTTAHRRFKNRFTGESLRFVFHPDYNHAELFVSPKLSQAIYESMCGFAAGK